jgi:hypothetical protein
LTDRSTLVTRRLGFAALPLACLVIRITAQAFGMVWSKATPSVLDNASRSALANTFERWWRPISTTLVFAIGWFWYVRFCTENRTGRQRAYRIVPYSLLALKSIMGLNLLAFAHSRQAGMDQREREDRINDFGRKPIGDSLQEQVSFDSRIPSRLFANPGCSARLEIQ